MCYFSHTNYDYYIVEASIMRSSQFIGKCGKISTMLKVTIRIVDRDPLFTSYPLADTILVKGGSLL
jgi:hypothetical protein